MSHYDILGAPANAEYAEIRSKYRAAILALHPDKLSGTNGQSLQAFSSASNDSLDEDNVCPPNKPRSTIKDLDVEDPQFNWATISGSGELCAGEGDVLLARFLRVQEAWGVLKDPKSRAKYDDLLQAERLAHEIKSTRIIGDEVHLREMEWGCVDLDHGKYVEYTYPCRCGDLIVVSQEELQMAGVEFDEEASQDAWRGIRVRAESHLPESNSLLLPCQSCSMHVRLLLFP